MTPFARRAAIDDLYTEDCVFYDPRSGVHRGRDEIDRIAGAIRATHPDFDTRPRPNRRNWAMDGRDPVGIGPPRRGTRPMQEPTSSLLAVAGSPHFTSFSMHSLAELTTPRAAPLR